MTLARKNIKLYNCLSLANARNDSKEKIYWYNSYHTCEFYGSDVTNDNANVQVTPEEVVLDADSAPVIGSNVAIDKANETYYRNAYPSALDPEPNGINLDLYKRPRFLNGRMDVGCCEADWKPVYSTDLANRRLTVTNVTPNVVETADHTVEVPNGESLDAVWTNPSGAERTYILNFRVTGDGTLTITVNGQEHAFAASDADQQFTFTSALASNDLRFAYAGDAEGSAELLKGASPQGLMLMVR